MALYNQFPAPAVLEPAVVRLPFIFAMDRAKEMRKRAAEFARMAREARDSVIHAELLRLAILYEAQADRLDRGESSPSDPGEAG